MDVRKLTFIFLALCSLPWPRTHTIAMSVAGPTNGLRIVVVGQRQDWSRERLVTNDLIRYDDVLLWMPFHDTGTVKVLRPKSLAYFIKVKLIDPDGKEVPKTSIGRYCGSKYEQLRSAVDTPVHPCIADGPWKENPLLTVLKCFPIRAANATLKCLSPKDLFHIEKRGLYLLELEIQLFVENPSSTNLWKMDLIRFPTLRIKVEKP